MSHRDPSSSASPEAAQPGAAETADQPAADSEAEIALDLADATGPDRLHILLVRHGPPETEKRRAISRRGYRRWLERYDEASIRPGARPPRKIVDAVATMARLYSSRLPRARHSASLIAPERPVEPDEVFNEAPLPVPPLPGVRMRPGGWAVTSRLMWCLGFAGDVEPVTATEARADQAARRLDAAAGRHGQVALIAHGWLNWRIARKLKKLGWRVDSQRHGVYWAHVHLSRERPAP
jgi:broad specificity phosphatase PhoE